MWFYTFILNATRLPTTPHYKATRTGWVHRQEIKEKADLTCTAVYIFPGMYKVKVYHDGHRATSAASILVVLVPHVNTSIPNAFCNQTKQRTCRSRSSQSQPRSFDRDHAGLQRQAAQTLAPSQLSTRLSAWTPRFLHLLFADSTHPNTRLGVR